MTAARANIVISVLTYHLVEDPCLYRLGEDLD